MHADAFADLGSGERPQRLDALLEEILLALDDHVGDATDGLAALVDVVDEELRPRDVLAYVLALVIGHRRRLDARAACRLKIGDELPVDRVHAKREAPRLDDLDLEVALLVADDDHVGAERDLTTTDARAVRPRRERVRGIRIEALLHPVPRAL